MKLHKFKKPSLGSLSLSFWHPRDTVNTQSLLGFQVAFLQYMHTFQSTLILYMFLSPGKDGVCWIQRQAGDKGWVMCDSDDLFKNTPQGSADLPVAHLKEESLEEASHTH